MTSIARTALVLLVTVMCLAPTAVAALCGPPVGATDVGLASLRYAWFFIESLAYARLAWQEVDSSADNRNPAVQLAGLKLAIEDFQCAATLVDPFQDTRTFDEFTATSAAGAALAYTTFARVSQRWATVLARGEGLTVEEAANLKVENEKAGELLIQAASAAGFALLQRQTNPALPMDRLTLTRVQRTKLQDALRGRFPAAGTQTVTSNEHSPDLAAKLLDRLLSNPRYKVADAP